MPGSTAGETPAAAIKGLTFTRFKHALSNRIVRYWVACEGPIGNRADFGARRAGMDAERVVISLDLRQPFHGTFSTWIRFGSLTPNSSNAALL